MSKFLFKNLLSTTYDKYSKSLSNFIKSSSFEYLILLRLIIGTPLFIQNICLSILKITKTKFLITSIIGFTPLMCFFSFIGNNIYELYEIKFITFTDILNTEFIVIFIILLSLLLIRIILNKNKND